MENKKIYFHLNNRGQSTVEYILLLVVIASLVMVVFKSNAFNNMVGQGMWGTLAGSMEYTARYGENGSEDTFGANYNTPTHPLYYNQNISRSRFFSPVEVYDE